MTRRRQRATALPRQTPEVHGNRWFSYDDAVRHSVGVGYRARASRLAEFRPHHPRPDEQCVRPFTSVRCRVRWFT
jgi:hypothetical protein